MLRENKRLIYCARTGQLDEVVALLSSRAIDVDFRNHDSNTALIYAARHGYCEIVRHLLHHKANGNVQGEENNTALIWAVRNVRLDVIRTLLENRTVSSNLCGQNECTALMWVQRVSCTKCGALQQKIARLLRDHQREELWRVLQPFLCADIVSVVISFVV